MQKYQRLSSDSQCVYRGLCDGWDVKSSKRPHTTCPIILAVNSLNYRSISAEKSAVPGRWWLAQKFLLKFPFLFSFRVLSACKINPITLRDLPHISPTIPFFKKEKKKERKKERKKGKSLSHVGLFVILWTVAHQASPSMGFSRQEHWRGLPFPSPGDLPDPGIKPGSPALQADALPSQPPGKPPSSICVQKCFWVSSTCFKYCSGCRECRSEKETFKQRFKCKEGVSLFCVEGEEHFR